MKDKMKENWMKFLPKAACAGFVLALLWSFFPFASACEALPDEVIRLHVVAHSDKEQDQQVKLKVRDAVLEEASRWYGEAEDREEANFLLCTHLDSLVQAANGVLEAEGFPQRATVEVTDMYFPTRDYETFRLPAGTYRALRVTIGAGEGQNWWCVVFPSLCLPGATAQEGMDSLSPPGRQVVEEKSGVQVKFKVVEWYEGLKAWLG